MNSTDLLKIKQEYEDLTRDYAMRQPYGIVTHEQESIYTGQMVDLSKEIFHRIQKYQLDQERKKLAPFLERVQRDPLIQVVSIPVGLMAALWIGKPFEFKLSEAIKTSLSTILPSRTAELKMSSPLVEGSLQVGVNAPVVRIKVPPNRISEGVSGEVVYRCQSNIWWASLSREISELLTLHVALYDIQYFSFKSGELQLRYNLRFDYLL